MTDVSLQARGVLPAATWDVTRYSLQQKPIFCLPNKMVRTRFQAAKRTVMPAVTGKLSLGKSMPSHMKSK